MNEYPVDIFREIEGTPLKETLLVEIPELFLENFNHPAEVYGRKVSYNVIEL